MILGTEGSRVLTITVPARELFDERTNKFLSLESRTIQLEHSLLSVSKWEDKWHEPFLGRAGMKTERTEQQVIDYIRCMTITRNVPPEFFDNLPPGTVEQIQAYIDDPHTATTFYDARQGNTRSRETITAEIIYYWMLKAGIPFECEKWNLGRLFALIRVCSIRDNPGKKMSRADVAAQNRSLNAARRAKLKTNG